VLVNYIRDYQIAHGVPTAQVYNVTMYILAGMLVLGFLCNLLVRPVAAKYFMSDEELAQERRLAHDRDASAKVGNTANASSIGFARRPAAILLSWAAVGIPIAWGVWITLQKAVALFV
jgi:hypothetical protein